MFKTFKALLVFMLCMQLSFIFTQPARADVGKSETSKTTQNEYWPSRVRFSANGGTEGRGIFYIDELFPLFYTKDQATLWFLNLKENWQTPNSQEYNMGTGLRHIFNDKFILGIHYFFDKKYSHKQIWHNQNGVGLEFLSQPFDFRFNWYNPTDKGKGTVVSNYYKFGPMELLQIGPQEEALGGVDFEFGVPVFEKQTKTRLYVGGFFFDSKLAKDVNGFRVRTETNLNKWLAFDTTFNRWGSGQNEVIGGFRVTVPFELGRVKDKGNPFQVSEMDYIHDRLFERVVRDIDVKTNTSGIGQVQEKVPGVDIIYADNSNTTGIEDGTLEHPYSNLSDAFDDPRYVGNGGPARYIYVFNGDGSSSGYSDGYTLAGNSVLWGSGYNGGFNGIPTPGFPLIESNSIYLANSNATVMGLALQNISGDAITWAYGSSISNINITHNIITGNSGNGIYLANYSTNSGWNITGNTITGNANSGIYLNNGDPEEETLLSNVNISGNEITGNSRGIYIDSYMPIANVNISGNNISGNMGGASGIDFYNYNTASNVSISGNTINENNGPGIYLYNDGLAQNFNISGNTISGNNSIRSGIDVYNYGTAANFDIKGNTITENGGDGIYLENNAGDGEIGPFDLGPLQPDDGEELPLGMFNFDISGNNISGNSGDGIHINNGGGDNVTTNAFGLLQDDSGPVVPIGDMYNFNITKNTISGNGDAGIRLENYLGGEVFLKGPLDLPPESEFTGGMTSFNISDNIITGNSSRQSGIDIYNEGFLEDLTIANNTISGNSGAGIDIYNDWGEFHDLTISDNTITGNYGSGIDIENYDDMGNVTISGNTISGNSSPTCGIDIYSEDAYTHDFTFSNNTISGNSGSGIDIYNQWGEMENFTFTLNKISENSGNGININNYQAGMYNFSFLLNTITNNGLLIIKDGLDGFGPRGLGGNGFSLNNYEGEAGDFSFSLNNINNNTGLGLYFGTTESDTYNIDLGGGAMGSLGLNTIQGNLGEYDLVNDTNDTIYAIGNTLNPSRIYGDVVY